MQHDAATDQMMVDGRSETGRSVPMRCRFTSAAMALAVVAMLGGCSAASGIKPSALFATTDQRPASPAIGGGAAALPPGPIQTDARVQFAPVIGATEDATAPLSRRLSARAGERGIAITGGDGASHVLKGYFSTVIDGGETTVVYVWDVLDPAGNRLHRIQGKEQAAGGAGWSSVTNQTMETIADRTIDELALWLTGAAG